MRLNSLAFRLFATAVASTMLILPVAGLIIYSVYRQEVEENFDERLRQILTIVHADSIDGAEQEPLTPGQAGEPLILIEKSVWYSQIKPLPETTGQTKSSTSLGSFVLPSPYEEGIQPDLQGIRWLDAVGPLNQKLRPAETIE